MRVYGIERRREVVDLTNQGTPHFSEIGLGAALAEVVRSGRFSASSTPDGIPPCAYYIITVGTPLRADAHQPRLDMIEKASQEVAGHLRDGASVILRSTVLIGTTRKTVLPILEASGRQFHLAMCPERTLEGDALRELATLPQIVGGLTEAAGDAAAALFSRLTHTIVRVSDPETAEMIKLVDNTSRDVRFAFANEVARACDALGINANDVIRYGKLGYSRTNVASPGLVGGPCLEKDSHILIASAALTGISLEITAASRLVNERQPAETVAAALTLLRERRPGPFNVGVAGLAFKGQPETDDLRGSMGLKVLRELQESSDVGELRVYDSVVSSAELQAFGDKLVVVDDLYEGCRNLDLLVIANNHPDYTRIDLERLLSQLRSDGLIYDYWNSLGEQPAALLRGRYYTVGNLGGKHR
jgi:UDP-N-acetyl-D-mannosaminuronic acid dehydrogenase